MTARHSACTLQVAASQPSRSPEMNPSTKRRGQQRDTKDLSGMTQEQVAQSVHAEEMAKRTEPLVTLLARIRNEGCWIPDGVRVSLGTYWLEMKLFDGPPLFSIPITEAEANSLPAWH